MIRTSWFCLVEKRHIARRLKQLNVVVVSANADGRAGFRVLDASIAGIKVRPGRGRTRAAANLGDAPCLWRIGPFLRLGRQGWQSPIRRIQDQRCAPSPNDRGTPVQPEIVVKTGCSVLPPVHVASGRRSLGSTSQQVFISVNGLSFEAHRLFLCQKLSVRQFFWPLEGRDGAIVPHALQVRLTPRRLRGARRLSGSGQWHQRHDRDHRTHRCETSMGHSASSWLSPLSSECTHDGPGYDGVQGHTDC